jgi:TPP-dependent 2-oxoacid decarboxylase
MNSSELTDLMECPLDALRKCIQTMPKEVAMATIRLRQQREAEKIRRTFTEMMYDRWIPNNCKRGETLTSEQIDILCRLCAEVLQAEGQAREQIATLYGSVNYNTPTKMGVAAKAD